MRPALSSRSSGVQGGSPRSCEKNGADHFRPVLTLPSWMLQTRLSQCGPWEGCEWRAVPRTGACTYTLPNGMYARSMHELPPPLCVRETAAARIARLGSCARTVLPLARPIDDQTVPAPRVSRSKNPTLAYGRRPAESTLTRCHDTRLASRRLRMLTMSGQTSAHRSTIAPEPGRRGIADRESLTPAQRIALTVALLNRGFDLLDGVARMSLAGCTRGAVQRRHRPEPARDPPRRAKDSSHRVDGDRWALSPHATGRGSPATTASQLNERTNTDERLPR